MKNFIFISPNFPTNYWKFCAELKKNGMNVLGIGDCPYDQLMPELRGALNEYYKVSSLENYDEVFRAVAFLTYKHGKIDWLESNNEYWLERDAMLRTAFNITTGFHTEDMQPVKYKSAMKANYAKAGIKTARWHIVRDYTGCKDFIAEVGYPVIVKPDNGVGASHTYKLKNDDELNYFFATKDETVYIMEEYVNGTVHTYDAVISSKGEPLFETGNVTIDSIMDIVNTNGNSCYYIEKTLPEAMRDVGRRTVAAVGNFSCSTKISPRSAKKATSSVWKSTCARPAVSARICSISPTRPTCIRSGRTWSPMTTAPSATRAANTSIAASAAAATARTL